MQAVAISWLLLVYKICMHGDLSNWVRLFNVALLYIAISMHNIAIYKNLSSCSYQECLPSPLSTVHTDQKVRPWLC